MTNLGIWRKKTLFSLPNDELKYMTKKTFFWPPNDELWNMTKKNLFTRARSKFIFFSQYYDSIGKKLSQKLIIYSILDRTVHFLVLFILFTVFLFSLGSLTILEKIIQKIKHTVGTYWMKWKKLHKNLHQFWFPSQTILVLSMTNLSTYMTKKNLFRPPNDEVKFYGFQALQPFNPRHRACLPEQSLKAYNLTMKRHKIRKNKLFLGNFKA
jgi:hypothetical protein